MAKIQGTALVHLTNAVSFLDTEVAREAYRKGEFPLSDKVTDLNLRYRWDLFWGVRGSTFLEGIEGLNDSHIDTALRSIVAPL